MRASEFELGKVDPFLLDFRLECDRIVIRKEEEERVNSTRGKMVLKASN